MEDAFYAYSTANIAGEYTSAEIAVINKRATRCAVSSKQLSEDQYLSQRSDCEAALFYALAEAMVNNDQLAWHSAFETYWYTLGPNGLGNVTSPSSETIKQYFDKDISSCKFVFEGIYSPVAVPS